MRIVIDLQGAQTASRFRGIGRYSLSLAKAIARNRGEHEVLIALSGFFPETIESIRAEFEGILSQDNIRVWNAPGPVRELEPENTWRRETAELIREAFLASLQPDTILILSLFEGYVDDAIVSIARLDKITPVSVILYDLIPLLNPDEYLKDVPTYEQHYLRKIDYIKRASLLFSISESSRQEGLLNLGFKEDLVINILAAVDSQFEPQKISDIQQKQLRLKFGLTKEYLMYSGATDQRKNHLRLISSYAKLPKRVRSSHQLVLVGGMPEDHKSNFLQHIKKCGLEQNEVILTGTVSDDEMVSLYNLCKAFVFPSWHEGFGLPALEAMKCGRAVIASNTSSLPEVVGYPEALFDPFDEDSMMRKIEHVLTNDKFRTKLEKHSMEQSKKFSWETCAKHSITALEKHYEKSEAVGKKTNNDKLETLLIEEIAKLAGTYDEEYLLLAAQDIAQNHQTKKKRQLLVDISELVQHDAKSGIQRVVRSILSELLFNPPKGMQIEPVYASTEHGYRYARNFTLRFLDCPTEILNDDPIEYHSGDIFLGLDLQPHIVPAQKEIYQQMRRHGVQVQFVVYDLLCVLLLQHFGEGADKVHVQWLEVITQSDGAVCISKSVAKELETWIKEHPVKRHRPFKISWFHLGADVGNSVPSKGIPDNAKEVLGLIEKRPSFLSVGTVEPRKGQAQTLAAFEHLWADNVDVNLVIVGKEGWMVEELAKKLRQHPEAGKRLFWLEGISDEYLEKIYSASTCLIAASEGEGFGLPLIEAAQHKLPIIARNIPVFKEVAGKNAHYFSGKNPKTIANSIKNWLEKYKQNKHPTSLSMNWLTWSQSADQLLKALSIDIEERK